MINVALCDNNTEELQYMADYVKIYASTQDEPYRIDTYTNGNDLLQVDKEYQIYLLDILMPNIDGITLGQKLHHKYSDAIIIYLTSCDEYAIDAYALEALQYLLKPVPYEKLAQTLDKALKLIVYEESACLHIATPDGVAQIKTKHIRYIEHYNKVLYFHMLDNTIIMSSNSSISLSQITDDLKEYPYFLQPHRAFIVNMNEIKNFSNDGLHMNNNQFIPVSQKRYKKIKEEYLSYLLYKGEG